MSTEENRRLRRWSPEDVIREIQDLKDRTAKRTSDDSHPIIAWILIRGRSWRYGHKGSRTKPIHPTPRSWTA